MKVEGVIQCKKVVPVAIHVGTTCLGGVRVRIHNLECGNDIGSFDVTVSPRHAVSLWRCLTGETGKCYVNDEGNRISISYEEGSETWLFKVDGFDAHLDADEALAIAWALRKSVAECLDTAPSFAMKDDMKDIPALFRCETKEFPLKVWVLAARRMLTGDCAENGVDQLGGCEQVYLTEEAARDAVREFMRPLVNDSFGETYWENRTVDDELDDIMAATDANKTDVWILDGQKQAFEVELTGREVLA